MRWPLVQRRRHCRRRRRRRRPQRSLRLGDVPSSCRSPIERVGIFVGFGFGIGGGVGVVIVRGDGGSGSRSKQAPGDAVATGVVMASAQPAQLAR